MRPAETARKWVAATTSTGLTRVWPDTPQCRQRPPRSWSASRSMSARPSAWTAPTITSTTGSLPRCARLGRAHAHADAHNHAHAQRSHFSCTLSPTTLPRRQDSLERAAETCFQEASCLSFDCTLSSLTCYLHRCVCAGCPQQPWLCPLDALPLTPSTCGPLLLPVCGESALMPLEARFAKALPAGPSTTSLMRADGVRSPWPLHAAWPTWPPCPRNRALHLCFLLQRRT